MAIEHFLRFVFVLYCTAVGVVLLLAPWTPGWDQMLAHLPGLRLLGAPLLRSALSGFGLVHLVWGFHDLHDLLRPECHPDGDRNSQTAGEK
ncbi:MAG: hypothetical protein GY856_48915 [bacterium]|nr:hypothetical protein [bacterium]